MSQGELDLALGRLEQSVAARRAAAMAKRQAAWGRIQREAPELAEVLTAVRAGFGKPASVRVSIDGERVI
jgi:hypothetical protein